MDRHKKRLHTGFCWGRGDELVMFRTIFRGVHHRGNPQSEPNHSRGLSGSSPTMQTVSFDELPAEMRRLVVHGRRVFVGLEAMRKEVLQAQSEAQQEDEVAEQRFKYLESLKIASMELRQVLGDCRGHLVDRLENQENDGKSGGKYEEERTYVDEIGAASAIWHLCEIMALNQSALVVDDFVAWAYKHYPRYDNPMQLVTEQLDVKNRGSDSEFFWHLVHGCGLQGDLLSCWKYLKRHRRYELALHDKTNGTLSEISEQCLYLFEDIRNLLLTMPRLVQSESANMTDFPMNDEDVKLWLSAAMTIEREIEFKSYWTQWNESVKELVSKFGHVIKEIDQLDHYDKGASPICDLLKIVTGDVEMIMSKLAGPRDTWVHLAAACLLYNAPTSRKDGMHMLVNQCMEWTETDVEGNPYDRMILGVFENKFTMVVQMLHEMFGDRWIDAHLTDLLSRAGAIDSTSTINAEELSSYLKAEDFLLGDLEMDMREYFVTLYAMQVGFGGLQRHRNAHPPGSWRIAADYLVSMDRLVQAHHHQDDTIMLPLGFLYMQLIVEKLYPVSDRFVEQVVRTCQLMGIPHESLLRERVVHHWFRCGGSVKYNSNKNSNNKRNNNDNFSGAANALIWASRCDDGLANRLLGVIFEFSSIETLDMLVRHLNANFRSIAINERIMSFLSKYYEIHHNLERASDLINQAPQKSDDLDDEEYRQQLEPCFQQAFALRDMAARDLCSLLRDDIPKRFYAPLIQKVLCWKNDNDNVLKHPPQISVHEANELIKCLEDASTSHNYKSNLRGIDSGELAIVRLLLIQCLARGSIASFS